MHPLWGDEAETALFAKNILKYGLPKGWDGVNIMGINNAVVLDKNLVNHTSPWGQYYLAAFSLKIFGEYSFAARLPFIILSILSIPLMYLLGLKLTQSKFIATLAIGLLSISVPFILFAYQSRHYAISSFAGILLTLSTFHLLHKKLWPKLLFVATAVLFFYGNYIVFIAFYSSTFISFLIYHLVKKTNLKEIIKFIALFIILSLIVAIFTVPWYLILKPFDTRGEIIILPILLFLKDLWYFFFEAYFLFNINNGFPTLFIPLLLIVLVTLIKKKRITDLLIQLLIPVIFLFIMSIFTVIGNVDTNFNEVRYTMIIYPYLVLLIATLIAKVWWWNRYIGILILVVYIGSNLFTMQPARSFLWEFASEVINPYPTPDKVVADYLKKNAKDSDSAFVNLDRDHEPLIFHLKDKIRFVNRVSLINTRIFPKNRGLIPRYIYDFRDSPDWVIMYSKRPIDTSFLLFDGRPLWPEVNLAKDYEEIILPIFFSDVSRPEIHLRDFYEIKPSYEDQIFIYRKIKNN